MASFHFRWVCALSLVAPASVLGQTSRAYDSAGVRIVTNGLTVGTKRSIRLAPTPVVRVGGTRDNLDEELGTYGGGISGLRLSDGRLVVANGTNLKFFDARGSLVHTAGRSGSGPGEFLRAGGLCRFGGDSLLVWDAQNRRLSIWTPTGVLVREYQAPGELQTSSCLKDGTLLVGGIPASSPQKDLPLATYPLLSPTGQARGALGPWPRLMVSGSLVRMVGAALHGERIYFGDARSMEYRVYERTGRLTMIVRAADRPIPITTAALKSRPMMCMKRTPTGPCEVLPTEITHWPSFYDLKVDDAGNVWLWTGRDDPHVWTVFGPDGVLRGQLVIRKNESGNYPIPTDFGFEEVTLLDRDELGSARLSVMKIVFPAAR